MIPGRVGYTVFNTGTDYTLMFLCLHNLALFFFYLHTKRCSFELRIKTSKSDDPRLLAIMKAGVKRS